MLLVSLSHIKYNFANVHYKILESQTTGGWEKVGGKQEAFDTISQLDSRKKMWSSEIYR